MDDNLNTLEREISLTRARLKANISAISSQSTLNDLKATVKAEVLEAKDDAVAYAQTAGTDMVRRGYDTLKRKAAANPAAALMIGAGIGWKLWKNPPVAAALAGVGLISLFSRRENDPLRSAAKFVRETAEDAASVTMETVSRTAHDLQEKPGSLVDGAKDLAQEIFGSDVLPSDSRTRPFSASNVNAAQSQVLLSLAGVAVAAAVGTAVQRFRSVNS